MTICYLKINYFLKMFIKYMSCRSALTSQQNHSFLSLSILSAAKFPADFSLMICFFNLQWLLRKWPSSLLAWRKCSLNSSLWRLEGLLKEKLTLFKMAIWCLVISCCLLTHNCQPEKGDCVVILIISVTSCCSLIHTALDLSVPSYCQEKQYSPFLL